MFFGLSALKEIGCFDEELESCTDRDLMVRFLAKHSAGNVVVIPEVLVTHHAGAGTVTYDRGKKTAGLDRFFAKHISLFTSHTLDRSLARTRQFFGYDNAAMVWKMFRMREEILHEEKIVVGVAVHNDKKTIRRCLESIVAQKDTNRNVWILINDDCSEDGWQAECQDILNRDRTLCLSVRNRNAAKTRNSLIAFAQNVLGQTFCLARLDADDELAGPHVLADAERIFESSGADAIIGSNKVRQGGVVLDRVNVATHKLAEGGYLLNRIKDMCMGMVEAEIPSCNLILGANCLSVRYPDRPSAEDHFLAVRLLIDKDVRVATAPELTYCIYSLDGSATSRNKGDDSYAVARQQLFVEARKLWAERILDSLWRNDLEYLGYGKNGIVFHDERTVYKVLMNKLPKPKMSHKTTYPAAEYIDIDGTRIMTYPYEQSEPVEEISEADAIDFLSDCWASKTLYLDCKKENFVRVDEHLKLIDFEHATPYSNLLFVNLCARMFLYARHGRRADILKLQRSALNNFRLPELEGLQDFMVGLFEHILNMESEGLHASARLHGLDYERYAIGELPNLETLFFERLRECRHMRDIRVEDDGMVAVGFAPIRKSEDRVSLLIRTCAMDAGTIEQNILHIVRQLSSPRTFTEVVVAIDCKQSDFLRQYTADCDLRKVISIVESLEERGVVDRHIMYDEAETRRLNKEWFGIECDATHSAKGNVNTPSLYSFEQCDADYILQMDSDVMIGRLDPDHDFLCDMIGQLKANDNVLSVGFNIYNRQDNEYYGFSNGGFVPEVRLGLIDKRRLMEHRPYPNELTGNGKLKLSWYRSVESLQKSCSWLCSIRGGDHRTFYVHPQNYRKTRAYSWLNILDRVEQGELPEMQYGKFDCEGSFIDWCGPKRYEDVVVVACFSDVAPRDFIRFWKSLRSQTYQKFGVLLYDNCSSNGTGELIGHIVDEIAGRVTFVKGRSRMTQLQCEHIAIRDYCGNPRSVIVRTDICGAFVGRDAIKQILEKYVFLGADVVCGRTLLADSLTPVLPNVNFAYPRETPAEAWGGLVSFRKYHFDSIPLKHLKHDDKEKLSENQWFESHATLAMMVPILEMSKSPWQMDSVDFFKESAHDEGPDVHHCAEEICAMPPVENSAVFIGRKRFWPTMEKIEIDITYACNLHCTGCNRSCDAVRTTERMSVADIANFIGQSKEAGIKWKLINILGGEPTLHPDFVEIMSMLQHDYADAFSPTTQIQVVSNGIEARSRKLCDDIEAQLPNVRIDRNSYKSSKEIDYFTPFADAPQDDPTFDGADYTSACWAAQYCGIGLNSHGYYGCAVCASIDRLTGGGNEAKRLTDLTDEAIGKQYDKFCRLCGNFKHYTQNSGDFTPRCEKAPMRNVVSKSWEEIYAKWK